MLYTIISARLFSIRKLSLFLYLLFLLPFSLFSQADNILTKRVYVTKSIGETAPPEIDGVISDSVWELMKWSFGFTEFGPDNGSAPSHQTKMKILYDEKNLYVAFQLLIPEPEKIEKRLSRRDGFEGDWVSMQIDSYNDKRTAFSFSVSATGVKGEEFISNDGKNRGPSWNPIWETKTRIDSLGWTAEMRIPLSQFRSNLVLRWEYIAGSEIFLVWSQGITAVGDADNGFGTIVDQQFLKRKPENTFLLKITYRFLG